MILFPLEEEELFDIPSLENAEEEDEFEDPEELEEEEEEEVEQNKHSKLKIAWKVVNTNFRIELTVCADTLADAKSAALELFDRSVKAIRGR